MNRFRRPPLALIAAFLLGGIVVPNVRLRWEPAHAAPAAVNPVLQAPEEVYARAAALAGPSVVNIDTEGRVRVRSLFDEDFLLGGPRYQRVTTSGSGIILNPYGDIVTNEHVVGNADSIKVTLEDGHQYTGRVVGTDHSTDVAVIHIAANNLPAARLGSSQQLVPGQLAVAIGNPYGLRFTVTHGIVSATGRPVKVQDRIYENLIQTDCAINPGNSGGALLDREGRVIGINTLVMDAANGVGFAIPIDTAERIVRELKKYGKVKRAWTGIYAGPVTQSIRRYLGIQEDGGAFVEGVVPGSPADEAGVQRGDIVMELGGKHVTDDDSLRRITEGLHIGEKTTIKVFRGNQRAAGEITLREAP